MAKLKNMPTEFTILFKKERVKQNLTQKELAEKIGWTKQRMADVENQRGYLSENIIRKAVDELFKTKKEKEKLLNAFRAARHKVRNVFNLKDKIINEIVNILITKDISYLNNLVNYLGRDEIS